MSYTVLSSQAEDYEGWQADRSTGVTASEMSILAHGSRAAWAKLKAEKQGIAPKWTGNKYTQWGHDREPVIMAFLEAEYGIVPNDHVLRNDDDPRAMGTPDGTHPKGDVLGEAKTSKKDRWERVSAGYVTQAQWNMRVTGASAVVLAVEYYDERDDGSLVPRYFNDFDVFIIDRDEDEIDYLNDLLEQFYAMGEVTEIDALLAERLEATDVLDEAKADLADVDARLHALIGDKDKFKYVSDLGTVTLVKPKARETFDKKKFGESHPELLEQFTVPGKAPKPSLRITPAKENA